MRLRPIQVLAGRTVAAAIPMAMPMSKRGWTWTMWRATDIVLVDVVSLL